MPDWNPFAAKPSDMNKLIKGDLRRARGERPPVEAAKERLDAARAALDLDADSDVLDAAVGELRDAGADLDRLYAAEQRAALERAAAAGESLFDQGARGTPPAPVSPSATLRAQVRARRDYDRGFVPSPRPTPDDLQAAAADERAATRGDGVRQRYDRPPRPHPGGPGAS